MLLRELMQKIDKDILLRVMKSPSGEIMFRRENASDIIQDELLDMEVKSIFDECGTLYIYVRKNTKKGSLGEFLNSLNLYDCIDVRIVNHSGKVEKELHSNNVCSSYKYGDYIVRKVGIVGDGFDSRMSVEIEPDDFVWTYVNFDNT